MPDSSSMDSECHDTISVLTSSTVRLAIGSNVPVQSNTIIRETVHILHCTAESNYMGAYGKGVGYQEMQSSAQNEKFIQLSRQR